MIRIDKILHWLSTYKFYLLVASLAIGLIFIVFSPLMIQKFYFNMPRPSPEFDCDDGTLLMMERLSALGVRSTPVLGNLKTSGESYLESDHVWLLVDIAGLRIAFDWGQPRVGSQYYEGFVVTYEQLLAFVQQDIDSQSNLVSESSY